VHGRSSLRGPKAAWRSPIYGHRAMVRKKITFNESMLEKTASSIQGNLCRQPLWYRATRRVPPAPHLPRGTSSEEITFALEDRLRRTYLARNPEAQDDAVDLSRGPRRAVRTSSVWSFVYEWICVMEDLGLTEEAAYRHVRNSRENKEPSEVRGTIRELSLQWALRTDEVIQTNMRDLVKLRSHVPPNWDIEKDSFKTKQSGTNIVVKAALGTSPVGSEDILQPEMAAGKPPQSLREQGELTPAEDGHVDDDGRAAIHFARATVQAKLDEVEARLLQLSLSSPGGPGDQAADVAYLEQDVPISERSIPREEFDFSVKAL